MARSPRRWLLAALLALTSAAVGPVVGLAAAARADIVPPPPGGRPLYVYGDSVLLGASTQIQGALREQGWNPIVKAYVGLSMPTAINAIRADRPGMADVVVLGLGNNYFGNAAAFHREIDDTMSILQGVRRVVWLNLREFRPDRTQANRELSLAVRRWSNLEVVDWNHQSLTIPNAFWNDGLHLRPEGAALMARLIAERVGAYLYGLPRFVIPIEGEVAQTYRPYVYWFGKPTIVPTPNVVTRGSFVGIAPTRTGNGYLLAASDGGVFAAGDARFRGSMGASPLNEPVVGIAATPSGRGYWLAAADGGIFAFGDARFHGSLGGLRINQPIVGISATPTGDGYYLVASDGGVFAFGDAKFLGSTGTMRLNRPIVGIAATPKGEGYWLVGFDGGVFSFGEGRFHGSRAMSPWFWPTSGVLSSRTGAGYLMLDQGGDIHPYGDARARGDRKDMEINDRFFAVARRPGGYWLAAQRPV
jgi:hypothetical protein